MSIHFKVVVASLGMLMLLLSCTTGEPIVREIDGITRAYTPKRIFGITYNTQVENFKSVEQAKDDIAIQAMEAQQRTEARRASIALWMGALLLGAAIACAIVAYLCKGWARWGGLAMLCAGMGGLCWGFIEWIDYLKWFALVLPLAAIGLFLYENRHFDVREWIDNRKDRQG